MRSRLAPLALVVGAAPLLISVAPGVAATAHRSARQRVRPSISITSAAKSGKSVKFVLGVDFPIPPGTSASACSGKVKASTKVGHKTTSWSGKLGAAAADCTAAIHGKLPKAKFGKKLAFTLSFPGNPAISAFGITKKLVVKTPPSGSGPGGTTTPGGTTPGGTTPPLSSPPPFNTGGEWFGTLADNVHGIHFTTNDTAVTIFENQGALVVPCDVSALSVNFLIHTSPFTGPGAFDGSETNPSAPADVTHVTGTLSGTTGHGTLEIVRHPPSQGTCTLNTTWTATWQP